MAALAAIIHTYVRLKNGSLIENMSSSDKFHEGKWQFVRLIDVFFLGPFMILLAADLREKNVAAELQRNSNATGVADWKWQTLGFFGITTIAVNLYFYLKIAKWI
jgi:hypothetical protein